MKILKYLLYALGALAAVVALAVAALVATFDPNAYKPRLQALVQDKFHRTIKLEGDIRLRIFPKIGMELAKVTISERDSPTSFATLRGAQLYLALLPLLQRQAVVDEIRITGLHANLLRHADGSTNFDDLRGGGSGAPQPDRPGDSKQAMGFDVSGIHVEDAGIRWTDERTQDSAELDIEHFSSGRLADRQTTPLDLTIHVRDARLGTDLSVALQTALTLDLTQQHYALAHLVMHIRGSTKGLTGIDATLNGELDVDPDLPRVRISALAVSAGLTQGPLIVHTLALTAPRIEADLKAQAYQVEHLALSADGQLGADRFKTVLDAPRLSLDGSRASAQPIHFQASLDGAARRGNLTLDLQGLHGDAQAFEIADLALGIDATQGPASLKGTLRSAVTGALNEQIFEVRKLGGTFTVSAPQLPHKSAEVPIALAARLDLKHGSLSGNLSTRVEDSALKATFGVAPFKAPRYTFDVSLDQLDLDHYLPPAQTSTAKAGPPSGDPPIDLSILRTLRLDGHVAILTLIASRLHLANLNVGIAADSGRLTIDPLSAQLYQGSLNGSATVQAEGNHIAVRQTLTGVAIGALLKDLLQKDPIDGRGTVALDLSTSGANVTAFKHALNGTARIALKDGAINGINLAESFRKAKAMLGGGASGADQAADASQKTDFSELTGSFVVHDGVAKNEDLSAKSPFLRLSGQGNIDIGNSTLDYLAQATLVGTAAGQGGQDLGSLKGIPVPVRVSGPFAAPKFHLEFADLLKGAAKAKVQEQIDQKKQELKGRLQDALGGALQGAGSPAGTGGQPGQAAVAKPPADRKPTPEDLLKGLLKR